MSKGEFKYPELNEAEQHAIRVIASSLYDNIKTENDKALKMYQELDLSQSLFLKSLFLKRPLYVKNF